MTAVILPREERAETEETGAVFRMTSNFRRSRIKGLAQHVENPSARFRLSNVGRITNALRAVAAIHAPAVDEADTCWECGLSWPCPTMEAVHVILTSEEGVIPEDGTDTAGRGSVTGAYRMDPRPGDI